MNIQNILVIAEGEISDSPLALKKALRLAKDSSIGIHILSVVYCESNEQSTLLDEKERHSVQTAIIAKAKQDIENQLQSECPDRANISYEISFDNDLCHAVDLTCKEKTFDLIIKTGHRSESLLHVPTDFHLLHFPRIPIIILRTKGWKSKPIVLATVNFSKHKKQQMELNKKVLDSAKELADLSGAKLQCCYVVPFSKILADFEIINEADLLNKFKIKHGAELLELTAQYGISDQGVHVKAGEPEKLITSIANQVKADLVVVGTHHRKGILGFGMGNSCEKILHLLRTDILAIKHQ
jgi:universal stress protein E